MVGDEMEFFSFWQVLQTCLFFLFRGPHQNAAAELTKQTAAFAFMAAQQIVVELGGAWTVHFGKTCLRHGVGNSHKIDSGRSMNS